MPGEILLSELLEELTDLTGGAAPQIGGVVARATRTSEDVADCALVDAGRLDLDPVEQPAVVEACPRLFPVREAGPERSCLVGPHDAQISQGEVLQILLRLAEVQVEQEFERTDVIQRDELRRPAMLGGDLERNVGQEVVDQLRFRPGDADVRPPRRLCARDQDVLGQACDEGGVVLRLEGSGLAACQEVVGRAFHVGNLGVPEERPVEDRAAPIDHPDQQALRVLGKALKPQDEGVVLVRQDRAVGGPDERQHFDEMVVIVIDR